MTYMIRRRPEQTVVSCSPGGCRSCLLYLICSCWGFYTCILDNGLRHCHLKKAPTWNKRFKAPRRVVRQLNTPLYSPGFLFPFLFFVCISLAPTWLCSNNAHHCRQNERWWSGRSKNWRWPLRIQAASLLLRQSHMVWSNVPSTCAICIVCIFKCALFRSGQPEKGN